MNRRWVDKRPIQFIYSVTDVGKHKKAQGRQKYEGLKNCYEDQA